MIQKKTLPANKRDLPEKRALGNMGNHMPYVRVGYGYVPYQEYGELYSPEEALKRGTLFPILDIPWGEYVPEIPKGEDSNYGR